MHPFPIEREIQPRPRPSQIARLAYLIWESQGRPLGREREHWTRAETLLRAQLGRAHEITLHPRSSALPCPARR